MWTRHRAVFIAPFLHPDVLWDFRLTRVKSINASGHKYGLSPLGVGWVVWRDTDDLPEETDLQRRLSRWASAHLRAELFATGGAKSSPNISSFLRLGRKGYHNVQQGCAETAQYLAEELGKTGHFDMLYNGHGGLPAVCYSLKSDKQRGYTLYDVSERMRMRGWQIASYPLPADRHDLVVQRVMVRHGMGRDLMELLVEDLDRTISFLDRNPLTNSEAGPTFHHGR